MVRGFWIPLISLFLLDAADLVGNFLFTFNLLVNIFVRNYIHMFDWHFSDD